MNILDFFKNLFSTPTKDFFPGVIDTDLEKDISIPQSEVVAQVAKPIFEKVTILKREYPLFEQGSQSSCVANSLCKLAGIMYSLIYKVFIDFSRRAFYSQRANKNIGDGTGMTWEDANRIATEIGFTLEQLEPSTGLTEAQVSVVDPRQYLLDIAKVFRLGNSISTPIDFDTVASTINITGKPFVVFFHFGPKEWFNNTIAKIVGNDRRWAHAVVVMKAINLNGTDYLVVDDSADKSGTYEGLKLVDRPFFNARCYLSRYFMQFKFEIGTGLLPKYDGTIISVQKILRYEGYFPMNVPLAENLGPVTKTALKQWQAKKGLQVTGLLDTQTIAMLVTLYN